MRGTANGLKDLEKRGVDGMWRRAGRASRRPPSGETSGLTGHMVEKLATPAGQYAERKWLSEESSTCWASGASACANWRRCGASGSLALNVKRLQGPGE